MYSRLRRTRSTTHRRYFCAGLTGTGQLRRRWNRAEHARELQQQHTDGRRADVPWRSSVRVLSDPPERQGAADCDAARRLPVGAQLGNHAGRPRGLPNDFPAPRLPGLSRRSAAPRASRQQHRRCDDRAHTRSTNSSSTSSGLASGRSTSTTCSSIARRRRWISSSGR